MEEKHSSKLERNNNAIRHFWNKTTEKCDCGCRVKVFVNSKWICLWKLNEILKEQGYKVSLSVKL